MAERWKMRKFLFFFFVEDQEFATYFRAFKGSLEKTKIFIDKFYQGRIKYPEILTNFNPLSDGAMIDQKLA